MGACPAGQVRPRQRHSFSTPAHQHTSTPAHQHTSLAKFSSLDAHFERFRNLCLSRLSLPSFSFPSASAAAHRGARPSTSWRRAQALSETDTHLPRSIPLAWAAWAAAALLLLSPSAQAENICQRLNVLSDDGTSCHLAGQNIFETRIPLLREDDFHDLNNLQELWLGLNGLGSLPEDIFQGLNNLQKLWLYDNNLSNLPQGIFQDLNNLRALWLYGNNLTCLPSLPNSLEGLYLVDNATNNLNNHNLPPCKPSKPFDETELSMGLLDSAPYAAVGSSPPRASP